MEQKHRLAVLGHRGSRATHPENTMMSFEEARRSGADGIELDVQFSADRQCVVYHDPKISAKHCLLNRKKPARALAIAGMTLAEIRQFDCASVFQRNFPRQQLEKKRFTPIPTLDEFFQWGRRKARHMEWVVELKMPPASQRTRPNRRVYARTVCALIRKSKVAKNVVLQSFDHRLLQECARELPSVTRSFLFDSERDFPERSRRLGAKRVSPNFRLLNPRTMNLCREYGIMVTPYTVNKPSDWKRAEALGVDAIITDYPAELVLFLKRRRA